MVLRRIWIPCAVSIAIMGSAEAQTMPRYDVEEYCRGVADFAGGSASIFSGCIKNEQRAYDSRKAEWGYLSAQLRSYCDEVARFTGGSYSILDGCIKNETKAANNKPSFKY